MNDFSDVGDVGNVGNIGDVAIVGDKKRENLNAVDGESAQKLQKKQRR